MKRKDFLYRFSLGVPPVLLGTPLLLHSGCEKNRIIQHPNSNTPRMPTGNMETPGIQNPQNSTSTSGEDEFKTLLPISNKISKGNLMAQSTVAVIKSGESTKVLGYQSGGLLGPTLSLGKGELLNIQFSNRLNENSNIHWHGLTPPPEMDGHPQDVHSPGADFRYQFRVNNRAGTYWYHPHPIHHTANQVYEGLARMILIRDDEEQLLNLPKGDREIPLIIQDKRNIDTHLDYSPGHHDTMGGYLGNYMIVNGTYKAYHPVKTTTYRLRVLNGSNGRIYDLALGNDLSFFLIGSDCGLLERAVQLRSISLAPGERVDLLVDFSNQKIGSTLFLMDNNSQQKLIKFLIEEQQNDGFIIPTELSKIKKTTPETAIKNRVFSLSNRNMGMGRIHRINNKSYDPERIDEVVKGKTVEIWEFDNTFGIFGHPMHLHGVQFQILERKGGRNRLLPWETGLKDTFLVSRGERVKIIIPFDNEKGRYVFHCHTLEHENDGMMLQYEIT